MTPSIPPPARPDLGVRQVLHDSLARLRCSDRHTLEPVRYRVARRRQLRPAVLIALSDEGAPRG